VGGPSGEQSSVVSDQEQPESVYLVHALIVRRDEVIICKTPFDYAQGGLSRQTASGRRSEILLQGDFSLGIWSSERSEASVPGPQQRGTGGTLILVWKHNRDRGHPP